MRGFTVFRMALLALLLFGAIAFLRPELIGRSGDRPTADLPPRVTAAAPRTSVPETRLAALPDGPVIGLADNRPETIFDPRFKRSGIKRIRVLVPYDDIARGGIRCEVIRWRDLVEFGSHAEAARRGLMRLEGKTYVVEDGDVLNVRFNV